MSLMSYPTLYKKGKTCGWGGVAVVFFFQLAFY